MPYVIYTADKVVILMGMSCFIGIGLAYFIAYSFIRLIYDANKRYDSGAQRESTEQTRKDTK